MITGGRGSASYRVPVAVPRVPSGLAAAVVLLSLAAVAVSIASLELIHPALSWNRDEPVYLWHVGVLESGRLTAPVGNPVDAFRPWLSGVDAGAYFSQYTLGWPLVLLGSATLLGTPAGAVVLGTVLAVVGAVLVSKELTGRDDLAIAVGICFLATPAVVLQAGVHLGYLFTVGLGNIALALGWSGLRAGSRLRLLASGLLLGWILLTRPFDAVVWGGVLVFGGVVRHRADVLRRIWPVVVGGLPFVALTFAYNLRITGELLTFPIVRTDPLDSFGFGDRRLMPGFRPVEYDLALALKSTAKNTAFFGVFLAGNVVACGLAVFGAWRDRRRPETWTLLVLAAAFPLGYFSFFGTNISSLTARLVGSIYYIPAIVPVLLLAISGALHLRQRSRLAFRAAAVGAVVLTVPVLVSRIDVNRRISVAQESWATSVEGLDEPSLVIVASSGPYLLFTNPAGRNEPTLDDEILYALDRGTENFDTIRAHPQRTPYLQIAAAHPEELGPREEPIAADARLVPLEVFEGSALELTARYRPMDGAAVVRPFVQVDGIVEWGSLSDVDAGPDGSSRATFRFGTDGIDGTEVPEGRSLVRFGFGAGDDMGGAGDAPRIRWEVPVERDGDTLTALLPAAQQVRFPVGPDFRWYPRPDYPGATVRASSGS